MRTGLLVCVVVGLSVLGMGQHFYAFYYDLSGGQDVSINLLNTMNSSTDYEIQVYDVDGNPLWRKSGTLDGYSADYFVLSDYVPTGTNSWGVVTVLSEELLVIGLEYLADEVVVSLDTVFQEVPLLDPGTPYWLGAYYTQAGNTTTGVVIMNPWPNSTSVVITVYNPTGSKLYQREVELAGHASEFIDLEGVVGAGGLIWGLVDVRMQGLAVVLALEYYGDVLDVKNIIGYYY